MLSPYPPLQPYLIPHALQPQYLGLLLVLFAMLLLTSGPLFILYTLLYTFQINSHFANKFSGSKPLFHASMKSHIFTPQHLTSSNALSLRLFNDCPPKQAMSILFTTVPLRKSGRSKTPNVVYLTTGEDKDSNTQIVNTR